MRRLRASSPEGVRGGKRGGRDVAVLAELPLIGIAFGAIALLLLLLVIAVLPLAFLALELLPAFLAYRVLLGKPWPVEARSGEGAGEAADLIAQALERGEEPAVA